VDVVDQYPDRAVLELVLECGDVSRGGLGVLGGIQ